MQATTGIPRPAQKSSRADRGVGYQQPNLTLTVLADGTLEVVANDAARESLTDVGGEDFPGAMFDLMEPYSTNGSFTLFDAAQADPFVGLTCAPCIAEGMNYDEDGTRRARGRVWWYRAYELRSYVSDLVETGRVVFPVGLLH